MSSLLASQLQSLARQRQPAVPSAVKKGKPSLLYDFQKAADVDLQTVYDVACQGLEDLTRLEPRFRAYRESLFSRASLDINPDQQTPEFLSKLNESIHNFCCLLSNHFLVPPAFKVLEYLIRRYRANERNVDALMTAALPYHSTNEFVRLVQTLSLGAPGSLWGWLAKMQTSGASLPRDLLAHRCVNDPQLLMFICKAAGQLGGASLGAAGSGASALRAHSRTFLSFYAVVLCEVLAVLPTVGEDFLAALLPYLLEGLGRGAAQDYRAATLMAVAELCSRATLGKDFIKVLLNTMLKHTEPVPEHIRTTLLVMAHMAVTQQHIRSLSEKTLKYLMALPNVVPELAVLAQRGNFRTGPLLLLIVRSLSASLITGGSTGRRCEGDLLSLAHSGVLRGEPARALASSLLEAGGAAKVDMAVRENCQRILRVLDQRYPESADAAVNSFLEPLRAQRQQHRNTGAADDKAKHKRRKTHHKTGAGSASDDEDDEDDETVAESAEAASAGLAPEERARFDFVRATFTSGGYSAPCGGTMLTLAAALSAPQAAIRRMALQQLDADLVAADKEPSTAAGVEAGSSAAASTVSEARTALTGAALNRLRDDDLGVVVAALGLSCLRELPSTALLDALAPLANRLGEFLYCTSKLPQLKAARKAARKVVGLLCHVGSVTASEEHRQAAALHLLALMLPCRRDPRVAIDAARGAVKLGMPLFSELKTALDMVEVQLKGTQAAAAGGGKASTGGKKTSAKGKGGAEPPTDTDGATHISKKAAQKAAAAGVERAVVSALAKAMGADPSVILPSVKQLVVASAVAAVSGGEAAEASSRRVQHLLLLASYAATTSVASSGKASKSHPPAVAAATLALLCFVVDLAEVLLPYARLVSGSEDKDWRAVFAKQVSAADGLPTDSHVAAVSNDAGVSSHAALILGALRASLARLPEPTDADADAQPATAKRVLGQLASLGYSPAALSDLPVLVVTRAVGPSARSAFLADIYAAPASSTSVDAPAASVAPLQSLALHVQSQLATPGDACGWLLSLLAALTSPERAVRSAACDCLAVVNELLAAAAAPGSSSSSAAAPGSSVAVPAHVAALLCSSLLVHRKLLCRDPEAVTALLQAALHAGPGPASAASPSSGNDPVSFSLPAAVTAELQSYLSSSLFGLSVDGAGVNTACLVLSCVAAKGDSVSAMGAELFTAGCAYLSRVVERLRKSPASATALDARAVQLLVASLYAPASVAAHGEAALSHLAEAAERLPSSTVAKPPAPAIAALAAVRLAAVRQISRELCALLPANGVVRELFSVLMGRYEGDPDEEVRAAARASLEAIPLSAELLVPLLDPPAAAGAAVTAASAASAADTAALGRSKKKSRKSESAATTDAITAVISPAPPLLDHVSLRNAVSALELLQWRAGIASPHLLVAACQSLLRRLLPVVGSIVSVSRDEDGAAADDANGDAVEEALDVKSSLAGYASTLALQALTALARNETGVEMRDEELQFDMELAVRMAREAPDAAVRNAALGLLAALATRMPEAALSHVLQVLAVVNQSAALQDDEHSRAIGATALAAVVPAWVAAGQRPAALWEQVVSSLPSLPGHRRLDVLLALKRSLPAVEEGLSDGLLVLLQHTAEPKQAATPPVPVANANGGGKTPKGSSKKAKQQAEAEKVSAPKETGASAEPSPSEWLPELASQLALQVELPMRLACCARVMELALAASNQQAHIALPRTVVVFVTAQLKLKVAVAAASASYHRPEPDSALDLGCRRLMEAALAQMQLLQPDKTVGGTAGGSNLATLAASRGLYGLFGALQGVMAADTYLQSLLTLAEHPADKVKRRAIKLFTDKVRGVRSEIQDQIELPQRVRNAKLRQASDAAARACGMLPPLLPLSSGASPLTRQLALVALSAIAVEFGTQQHAALLAGVPAVLASTKDSHASLRASALATVAGFVRALEARLVPVLPATVAAAVAAADSAWARLARAGGAAPQPDAEMPDANGDTDDDEEDSDDEGGVEARRRRARGGGDAQEAALELSSALACLNALVETLGGFLSPHLPSVLSILLNARVLACTTAGCDKFAASIRSRLPTAVSPRLLLPALFDRLEPCILAAADASDAATGAAPTVALLQMMGSTAAALEAKVAAQHCDGIFAFLLRALDVRQRRPSALAMHGDAAIDAVEAATIDALVALVMKLSEARFKPLFLRLLEWASTISVPEAPGARGEASYLGRMLAIFGAVSALADRLRSVLVPYYRYLLDLCVQHLGEEDGGGKAGRSKKKARRSAAAAMAAAEDGSLAGGDAAAAYRDHQLCMIWLLRLRILRALHRCFLHDSVGFVDADRFARLQPALVSQLAADVPDVAVPYLVSHHADRDLSAYVSLGRSTRVYTAPDGASSLGPLGAAAVGCLLAMAVAANSDALWKPLNHATLMLTRSAGVRTRALALEVVAQLVDRLREEYLVLLPEALPFLSELLEDPDAAVAARVREVVAQLEEISGEKLDEYLKV